MKSKILFTVVVYDSDAENVKDYVKAVRQAFLSNYTLFQISIGVIRPVGQGPIIKSPREKGKDKIWQKNIDFEALFRFEKT